MYFPGVFDGPKKGPKWGLEYVRHLKNADTSILIVLLGCAKTGVSSIMTLPFDIS